MRLGLSSAAAPDASLAELVEACGRRGLSALELIDGDGHGISARAGAASDQVFGLGASAPVELATYRVECDADSRILADLSRRLRTTIVLAASDDPEDHVPDAHSIVAYGGRAAVVLGGADAARYAEHLAETGVQVCWEVNPAHEPVHDESLQAVLRCREDLHSVRLLGGGPEASMHEGRGVNTLLRKLALSSWQGVLILAPGSTRYDVAWQHWLGRGSGWGCGSAGATKTMVPLVAVPDDGGLK